LESPTVFIGHSLRVARLRSMPVPLPILRLLSAVVSIVGRPALVPMSSVAVPVVSRWRTIKFLPTGSSIRLRVSMWLTVVVTSMTIPVNS
jgi:hypothetical protein